MEASLKNCQGKKRRGGGEEKGEREDLWGGGRERERKGRAARGKEAALAEATSRRGSAAATRANCDGVVIKVT